MGCGGRSTRPATSAWSAPLPERGPSALSTSGRICLLIGARGFVGGHVRRAAAEAGLDVVAASRRSSDEAPPCDLLDPVAVEECLSTVAPELIVNAAGDPSVARSWQHPDAAYALNAEGVRNLLEAAGRMTPT